MKILLFCCKGFEMMEFAPFIDVMGWARNDFGIGIDVVTAGFTKAVDSAFGVPVPVDQTYDEIRIDEYDALALGASGILRGRKATTYHLGDGRRQKQLASFGANVIPDHEIVVDDHIITSFCPEPHLALLLNCWG